MPFTIVGVNIPVTNPKLVKAMEAFQTKQTPQNEQAMLEQLKAAHYLMVFEGTVHPNTPDAEGKMTLQKNSKLSFPMLSGRHGERLHFAFTDWPALNKMNNSPGQQTLIVQFDDLSYMVLDGKQDSAGVVINPGLHNLFIDRQRLAFMSGRANPQIVKKDTQVRLGEPANYPHKLVAAATKAIRE